MDSTNKPTKTRINPPFLVRKALDYEVRWHHRESLKEGLQLTSFKGDIKHEDETYRIIIFNKRELTTPQKIKK